MSKETKMNKAAFFYAKHTEIPLVETNATFYVEERAEQFLSWLKHRLDNARRDVFAGNYDLECIELETGSVKPPEDPGGAFVLEVPGHFLDDYVLEPEPFGFAPIRFEVTSAVPGQTTVVGRVRNFNRLVDEFLRKLLGAVEAQWPGALDLLEIRTAKLHTQIDDDTWDEWTATAQALETSLRPPVQAAPTTGEPTLHAQSAHLDGEQVNVEDSHACPAPPPRKAKPQQPKKPDRGTTDRAGWLEWFKYSDAMKRSGYKYTLKDVADACGYSHGYVRQKHAELKYELEPPNES